MSAMSDALENQLLLLLFNNTPITLIGDASGILGSAVAGSFYVSLHTSDPGETGDQSTNETIYGGYTRVAVARTAGGWTVSGSDVTNAAEVTFPTCTSGTPTLTHFGIGTSASGAGKLLVKGALGSSFPLSTGLAPRFPAGALDGALA